MTEPGILSRIAGFLPVTLLLFAFYGFIGYGWYTGHIGILPALLALGFTIATGKAFLRVGRYQRWKAQWDKMGATDDAPPAPKSNGLGNLVTFGVVAVLVGVPVLIGCVVKNRYHANDLAALWVVVAAVVVIIKAVQFARGYVRRSRERSDEKAMAASVSWMLGRASSSPSWKAARRQLPDYTRQVLRGKVSPGLGQAKPKAIATP